MNDSMNRVMLIGESEGVTGKEFAEMVHHLPQRNLDVLDSFTEAGVRIMVREFKRRARIDDDELASQRDKLAAIAKEEGVRPDLFANLSLTFLSFSLHLPDSQLREYVREEHLCWMRDHEPASIQAH